MKTNATSHSRYNINYHLVWCPKYRHQVLTDQIETYLKKLIYNICDHYKYEVLTMEVMPDYIHLFVSVKPYVSPTEVVKTIKSITAVWIFKKFPNLKKRKFWGSGLWSKGYYVGTAGPVSAETIQKYIENQKLV
ncbi:transposase IS200-family protein [Desulforamulus reducens MI-1]|uniref:Transposase IS200-family protein n=1 Tax=Desulforamulus reducens (strain ATCC BAA-1160 / DSM 100696 / MI-1) TaxID=349161 RepID=A4J2W0_DESRM|nr:IS200/IS605 family transposase [Desulforamulus reducens]ABO49413.1 transposase IS200-family protein [Desulforamulus reducens MI-1]